MRAGLIGLGLVLILATLGWAAGSADEVRSLAGRPALRVVVAPVNQGALAVGINATKLKNMIVARLEFSGVKLKNRGWPMLLADVSCYGRLCFLGMQVIQPVRLARPPRQNLAATTWFFKGAAGARNVLRAMARVCDLLVRDYRRAR